MEFAATTDLLRDFMRPGVRQPGPSFWYNLSHMSDDPQAEQKIAEYLAHSRQAAETGRLVLADGDYMAILSLVEALAQELGDNLARLVLFGSKARGDSHGDSDIDVLVILDRLDADSRWLVRATAADCSLEYDVLFNTHVCDRAGWEGLVAGQGTLWREVERDGVLLNAAVV